MSMHQVIPALWIGDLPSALDVTNLKAHKIFSILSVMRGRLRIHETFIQHQILLDDEEGADVLRHLLPSIHFIQAELDKGRGVLVHCHAGISRSATIVAAYLMYSQNIDVEQALAMIRSVRPNVEPNEGFLRQLEIFHQAHFKVTRRDKSIRMYYMQRALDEIMNGDGTLSETDMFAKYPYTPSDSMPATPGAPRRRIRCKLCRRELATREHMLDHGQLGPPTPATRSPATSRRPSGTSANANAVQISPRRPSVSQVLGENLAHPAAHPRRPSLLSDTLSMTALQPTSAEGSVSAEGESKATTTTPATIGEDKPQKRLLPPIPLGTNANDALLSMSAIEDDSDDEEDMESAKDLPTSHVQNPAEMSSEAAWIIGRRLSDAMKMPPPEPDDKIQPEPANEGGQAPDLAAPLSSHPKLSGLKSPMALTPIQKVAAPISAPILINPKCSGYFVEPMKWMESFLESGDVAGKIVCPNPKCGAKLGNFDWAGVQCGCKQWVTPGFCISRSKVDEVL